jgi:hypothetical protein
VVAREFQSDAFHGRGRPLAIALSDLGPSPVPATVAQERCATALLEEREMHFAWAVSASCRMSPSVGVDLGQRAISPLARPIKGQSLIAITADAARRGYASALERRVP